MMHAALASLETGRTVPAQLCRCCALGGQTSPAQLYQSCCTSSTLPVLRPRRPTAVVASPPGVQEQLLLLPTKGFDQKQSTVDPWPACRSSYCSFKRRHLIRNNRL